MYVHAFWVARVQLSDPIDAYFEYWVLPLGGIQVLGGLKCL